MSFWCKRNKWIHDQTNCDPRQSIAYALTLHKFFYGNFASFKFTVEATRRVETTLEGHLKLNVDEALFFDKYKVGVCMILMDTQGDTPKC